MFEILRFAQYDKCFVVGKLPKAPSLRVSAFGSLETPSLAEEAWGWVSLSLVKMREIRHCALALHCMSIFRHCENRVAIRGNSNETLGQRMDCHAFGILTIPNARNDKSACVCLQLPTLLEKRRWYLPTP